MDVIDGSVVHPTWTETSLPDPIPVVLSDACRALDPMLSTSPMTFFRVHLIRPPKN